MGGEKVGQEAASLCNSRQLPYATPVGCVLRPSCRLSPACLPGGPGVAASIRRCAPRGSCSTAQRSGQIFWGAWRRGLHTPFLGPSRAGSRGSVELHHGRAGRSDTRRSRSTQFLEPTCAAMTGTSPRRAVLETAAPGRTLVSSSAARRPTFHNWYAQRSRGFFRAGDSTRRQSTDAEWRAPGRIL